MPTIQVNGIPVDFPKDPYSCQVDYMGKVIQALSSGENALLESPTGTGKTLSLLCSTLAWQAAHVGSTPAATASCDSGSLPAGSPSSDRNGVIVYATRTHSQLSQVIRELRDTSYRPKMAVLGSRDQLCVHEKVSKLKTASLNHACQVAVSRHTCQFKNNLESMIDGGSAFVASNEVTDIEDLVKMGRRRVVCPYYYSRDSSATADIVFMPYNYLLDGAIRKTIKINLQNSIVIFDEAHNLEQVASDAASCSFSSADLAACIKEMQQVLEILKTEHNRKADNGSKPSKPSRTESGVDRPSLPASVAVLRALFELEKIFDRVVLTHNDDTDTSCAIHPGSWLVNALIHAGFNSESSIDCVRKCALMLMDEAEQALSGLESAGAALPTPEPKLSAFASAMDRVLSTGRVEHADFQVFISEELQKGKKAALGPSNVTQLFHQAHQSKKRVVNFWCFSTGVALKNLKEQGVRSIILTSGTLSPMEAMKEDLRIPFSVELQNPHVVGKNQVWVGAIGKSSAEKSLNSSFANRDTTMYKDELGQSILDISSALLSRGGISSSTQAVELSSTELQAIRGGVLVFFPAYHLMDSTIERWKFTGMFKRLSALAGSVVVESRSRFKSALSSAEEPSSIAKTGKKLEESEADQEGLMGLIAEFEDSIAKRGSCMLLAVCRGKAAEGVDFSDRKGRVVIVTGIPFAPYKDPWVVLKRLYLDAKCGAGAKLLAPSCPPSEAGSARPTAPPSTASTSSVYANNPSVYAAKLGLATAPVDPAISTSSTSSSSASIAGPSPAGNVWAAARQSVAASAAATALSASAVALGGRSGGLALRASGSLSGAMWYQQAASRAVNQCLGRVIRHKNDWGAVCLLDERFLQDRQLGQLSEWMRPIVKKHARLSEALKTLRQFFQGVARDDRLRITSTAAMAQMPPPPPPPSAILPISLPRPAAAPPASKSVITRIVEISEAQLPASQDDPASYIDQHLLLTQPGEESLPTDLVPFSRTRLPVSQPAAVAVQSTDLKSKLDRLKARDLVEKMASTKGLVHSLAGRPAVTQTAMHAWTAGMSASASLSTPALALDEDDLTKPSSVSVAAFGLSQQDEHDPFSQAGSGGGLLGSQSASGCSAGSSQRRSTAVTAAAFSSIVPPPQSGPTAPISTVEQIKQLLAKWKAALSATQQEALRGVLVVAAREGLQHPSQMKAFLDQFAEVVGSVWSLEDQTASLRALSILVKGGDADELDGRRELYLQLVSQRYQRLAKKRRLQQLEREALETQGVEEGRPPPQTPAETPRPPEGDTATQRGTKRAQQLLQRVSGGTQAAPASLLARLHSLSSLELAGARGERTIAMGDPPSQGSSRLQCSVCKEMADTPCAAKCGHVCCQPCWVSWLKVKPSCPICRAPASQQSVARLVIRSEKAPPSKVARM